MPEFSAMFAEDEWVFVVGFTGRREGMCPAQKAHVRGFLTALKLTSKDALLGLHGDCVGADEEFDAICRELGIKTACMPCTWKGKVDHELRANTGAEQMSEPTTPYARNRAIVHTSTVVLGTPPTETFVKHSGTWYTLDYALKLSIPRVIFTPTTCDDYGDVLLPD